MSKIKKKKAAQKLAGKNGKGGQRGEKQEMERKYAKGINMGLNPFQSTLKEMARKTFGLISIQTAYRQKRFTY